jgi:S-adenosylmethionine:tRNA ribosyltransferase-isomerase
MASRGSIRSWCKVRPQKKWKDGQVLEHEGGLRAERLKSENGVSLLQFSWPGSQTWAEILAEVGRIPLPPYMRRSDTHEDRDRYQSVFARHEGSVAAPTASLHWTPEMMNRWREVCADTQAVTLHVGAGTFQPLTAESIGDHTMHAEEVMISRSTLLALSDGMPVLAMGTTAARTIESLYWWAEQWKRLGIMPTYVDQWAPYTEGQTPGDSLAGSNTLERSDAKSERLDPEVSALLRWAALELEVLDQEVVSFRTALIIAPGYSFKIVKALITNFHQPQSTLLLLIAAGLGPVWRSIYEHALSQDYRFLSYGDANLYRW